MKQGDFLDSAEDLEAIVRFLFNVTKFFSGKFKVPFTLSFSDFTEALPRAVQDQLYYCVDYHINPSGYDASKLTAFLAYHLFKASQDRFNTAPMFYGYIFLLQAAHGRAPLPPDYLESGIPKLEGLCQNLHTFLRNFNVPVPSYAFLKGVQQTARAVRQALP